MLEPMTLHGTPAIDLNADLGEGFGPWTMGDDAALLDVVTSANVACGFHAGDPIIMRRTIRNARQRGVDLGAHPAFLDLWGFGRRPMPHERPEDVEALVLYQLGALQALAQAEQSQVRHLKAHGALANQAAESLLLARAIGRALQLAGAGMTWIVMPHTALHQAALELGLPHALEAYVDRAYEADGHLVPRQQPGALIHDPDVAAARAVRMVRDQGLPLQDGNLLATPIDTLCVHGDSPGAVQMARAVRAALLQAGIRVRPLSLR